MPKTIYNNNYYYIITIISISHLIFDAYLYLFLCVAFRGMSTKWAGIQPLADGSLVDDEKI